MRKYKALEKLWPKTMSHFKKNWWKWLLFISICGLSWSGYSCQYDGKEFKKTTPLQKQVKK